MKKKTIFLKRYPIVHFICTTSICIIESAARMIGSANDSHITCIYLNNTWDIYLN